MHGNQNGGATPALYICVFIAVLSSFLWGYHTAVMSPAEATCLPGHDALSWSLVVTAMVVGMVAGSVLGNPLKERIGGKRTIMLTGLANVTGGLLLIFTGESVALAMVARALVGVAAGLTMCAVPVYIGEVAPPQLRQKLNGLPQLMNCVGILTSQLLGFFGSDAAGLFGCSVAVAVLQLLAAVAFPLAQTPEDTIIREVRRQSGGRARDKKKQQAVEASQRLYGFNEKEAASHVDSIETAVNGGSGSVLQKVLGTFQGSGKSSEGSSKSGLFSDAAYSKMTISVIVLNLAQQLSGFNAILQYSATFFKPLFSNPNLPTVLVGSANLIGSVCTTSVMDSTPRKRLLAISLGGMLLSTAVVATCSGMVVVAAVVTFALCFQVGLGPLPGCFASEMYDESRKAKAQGLAVTMNNTANFLVTLSFPIVYPILQVFTFVFFGAVLAAALAFACLVIPETLNKTPAQVHASLSAANGDYQTLE